MSRECAQAILTHHFGPWGKIEFPYVEMGRIDSLHLFGETELMIFAIYWHNRYRWKRVLDIGANIGLHSVLLAKLGMQVYAYEPDVLHFSHLENNLHANNMTPLVFARRQAVHTRTGKHLFVRVLNNTTGSHLLGYKDSYGPTEKVEVDVIDCRKLWPMADFAKIDCEGNEADLIETLERRDVEDFQAVLEVRNTENARRIFAHCNSIRLPMWSQKTDWRKVEHFEAMPHKNRDGSLFIGHRGPFE